MTKIKVSATALLLFTLVGAAPLTASAPLSASAAVSKKDNVEIIKVQNADVKIVFNGVGLTPPDGQMVFIHKNVTYVPIRFMSYGLKKSVSWDSNNLIVTINEPNSSESIIIKEYIKNIINNKSSFVSLKSATLKSVDAKFNFSGSVKTLPTGQSSFIYNGNLYVPLRFFSESVGNTIVWDQKNKTIIASSNNEGITKETGKLDSTATPAPTTTPAPTATPIASGTAGKVSYEQITSATEAKLNALKAQSQSTLFNIALEYVSASDDAVKQSILSKGKQQLASFTASFNGIISEAEKELISNGYSTQIIQQYREAFEAEMKAGLSLAEGMTN